MKLKRNEKILVACLGVMSVFLIGSVLFSALVRPLRQLGASRDSLIEKIASQKKELVVAEAAKKAVDEWNARSLPSDSQVAQSVYHNWLLTTVDDLGIRDPKVEQSTAKGVRDVFNNLGFSIRGQGSMDQMLELLHTFYASGHLHQLRSVTATPTSDPETLQLDLSIEALSLPGALSTEELPSEPVGQVALADLDEYRSTILERHLFRPYSFTPVAPVITETVYEPPPPKPAGFDHSQYTFVDGIVEVNGKPQVWIRARTKGQKFRLFEGEAFQIGDTKATVVAIHRRSVELEVEGETRVIALGRNLADADFSHQ